MAYPTAQRRDPYPFWLILNLLSLDAPLVALLWQQLTADAFHVRPSPSGRILLALAVWSIYLLDRILDVRSKSLPSEPARHRFTREHLRSMAALLTACVLVGGLMALNADRPILFVGLAMGSAVMAYFLAVHAAHLRFPKPVAVAMIFASGVAAGPWFRTSFDPAVLYAATAFGALCWANLELIDIVEGVSQTGLYPIRCAGIALLAAWSPLALPILLSLGGLFALYLLRSPLPSEALRVLADAALLLPIVFV